MSDPPRRPEKLETELAALSRYLSDEIPPMIFVDAAETLFDAPIEHVGREIQAWISAQYRHDDATQPSDYLYHAARKIFILAELELVPHATVRGFLERLVPVLLRICPAAERDRLEEGLGNLSRSSTGGATPAGVIHRPVTSRRPHQAAPAGTGSPRPREAAAADDGPRGASFPTETTLHRLNALLDRLAIASAAGGLPAQQGPEEPAGGGASGPRRIDHALLPDVVEAASAGARSSVDVEQQLRLVPELNLTLGERSLVRALSRGVPDWAIAPRDPESEARQPTTRALRAMHTVISRAGTTRNTYDRFNELVTVAVEEFNRGSLGRAVTLLDLAERMIADGEIDTNTARMVRSQTLEDVDRERLRTAAEPESQHGLVRSFMSFFPRLSVDELLAELCVEKDRNRRRSLIALLTAYGPAARHAAMEALDESLTGAQSRPWYVERNLLHLMRRIHRVAGRADEHEIDLLVRASAVERAVPVVREALTLLGQVDNVRAEKTLIARVSEIERALLGQSQVAHRADELELLLDTAISALAKFDSLEGVGAIVDHAFRRKPQLGDTTARLGALSGRDLSSKPTVVRRLLAALRDELPARVLGITVAREQRLHTVERLIATVAATDTPEIRRTLSEIVGRFPGQPFATAAEQALARLAHRPESAADERSATLSGDLSVFGLPSLLQNLADAGASGTLVLLDEDGGERASLALAGGAVRDAETARLRGAPAVFQLLERPFPGRFVFASESSPATGGDGIALVPLLLEGMRRYDELVRAITVAGDHDRFRATGRDRTDVPGEDDSTLVERVWSEAARGTPPVDVEAAVAVDSYRVRRMFEHWIEEGALAPAPGRNEAPPPESE